MKQFGISGDLTPFEPANPALDIPDGDPLELKKVTDQSMNAFYGELANAITKSGQTLTPTNGTSPNPNQLWNAISSARCETVRTGSTTGVITVGQVLTNTLNFVAQCDGVVLLNGTVTCSENGGAYEQILLVNSAELIGTSSSLTSITTSKLFCTKGTTYAFTQRILVKASGANYLDAYLSYLFLAGS